MSDVPTFGVEEEFLLVDRDSGEPAGVNRAVADRAARNGVELDLELTSCQVETTSSVLSSTDDLRAEIAGLRRVVADAAEATGVRLLAVGLPPSVPSEFPITDTPRYRRIAERFGMIAHEQGICGCHVHVAVPDPAAGIRVSNRLRPWLPTLLALTANSAIYRGADTGHASWRSVLWARWPSAGPPPHFDTEDAYDELVAAMRAAGAMIDEGQVYWDVRPSADYPTVEVRVSDVCATVDEVVVYAALVRALVMTALDEERRGCPLPAVSPHALRAACWRSAREGVTGDAVQALDGLIEHVVAALRLAGDEDLVRRGVARVAADGNGAVRQRMAWGERHDVADVVAEAARATLAGL
jgi:carboxylate-amine ligase